MLLTGRSQDTACPNMMWRRYGHEPEVTRHGCISGRGNIFRAYTAVLQQQLLNKGLADTGIILAECFDEEIIDEVYTPYSNLSVAVTLRADGDVSKEVVGSIAESLKLSTDYERLVEIICAESLQLVTFTITEKGYALKDNTGDFFPWIKAELGAFEKRPESIIGVLTRLLYARFQENSAPLAVVSLDNCSHNGTLLQNAVMTFAKEWCRRGKVGSDFIEYLSSEDKVAFTWSMIDKITPRPAPAVARILVEDGLENVRTVCTSRNSYVAVL